MPNKHRPITTGVQNRWLNRQPPDSNSIFIIDHHPIARRGLVDLIEAEPELKVCGEASDVDTALESISEHQPALAILDISMKESNGLEQMKMLQSKQPHVSILVLSAYGESIYAERAIKAGARGFATKRQPCEKIIEAIHCVLSGSLYLSSRLQSRLAERYLNGESLDSGSSVDNLSDRELCVFEMIGRGKTTRQIATSLALSVKTIESHREHIKNKLMIDNSAKLAQRATQWVEWNQIH